MTDPDNRERTAGGLVGKAVGAAKKVAGTVMDDDQLAREGRLQEAQADADREAAERAQEADRREAQAEDARQQTETEAEIARTGAETVREYLATAAEQARGAA